LKLKLRRFDGSGELRGRERKRRKRGNEGVVV